MKNCEPGGMQVQLMVLSSAMSFIPFVFGPEFAIAKIPAPVKRRSGCISSSL